MRLSLVNGLALVAASVLTGAACTSSADGRSSTAASTSAAPAAGKSPATATTATTATPGRAPDSLAAAADLGRIEGSPAAKVWLVEVSDFQCPYCKEWHDQTYPTVYDRYVKTGRVRLAYVNFPLAMHPHARAAATSAMCTAAQGRFWPMQDTLFATQNRWEGLSDAQAQAFFDSAAVRLGVNATAYRRCLGSPSIAALIAADEARATRAGVNSTPTFLINAGGKSFPRIEGAIPTAELERALDAALAATR